MSWFCKWRREKNGAKWEINKIIGYTATVTVYICTVIVANVSICTILEGLMWKIFGVKCVKLVVFCVLQMFTSTDVDALRQLVVEILMDINLGRRWRGPIAMALRSVEAMAFLVFPVVGFSIFMVISKTLNQIELNNHSGHCNFPAIFNFGDSNSDTGGKSAVFDLLPSPNGDTFFGKPSGRFCDQGTNREIKKKVF